MNKNIAFLFPGQGAQKVGMGKDLYESYDEVKKVFNDASNISGVDVATLCFNGIRKDYTGDSYVEIDEVGDDLNNTENTQIAIATLSLAILEVLKNKGIEANISAGLSLGEYTALIYSNMISFEEGIKLLKSRGYYMQHKVPSAEYMMLAVIGVDSKIIEEVCDAVRKEGKFVIPANYNYSNQTVISGVKEAVEAATELLKEKGAKKMVPLKTSGPFHTPLLNEAKAEFEKELSNVKFEITDKTVLKNIDGMPYSKEDNINELLGKHIVSPVRFDKIIKYMHDVGIDTFIEIGPGRALTGFIKKELENVNLINVSDKESLESLLKMFE